MNFIVSHSAIRQGSYLKLEEFGRDYAFENYTREIDIFPDTLTYVPFKLWRIYAPPFFGKSTLSKTSDIVFDTDDDSDIKNKTGFLFSNLIADIDFDVYFIPTIQRKFLRFKRIIEKFGWNEVADNAFRRLCLVNFGYSVLSQLEKNIKTTQLVIFNDKSDINMKNDILVVENVLSFWITPPENNTILILDDLERRLTKDIPMSQFLTNEDFKGYKLSEKDVLKE